jgi:hypothetical protein
MIEIVTFTKHGGPLTKRIYIGADGKPVSDGSACTMASGTATRTRLNSQQELAEHIGNLKSDQAIATGRLRADLPDTVEVTTKAKAAINANAKNTITRTREFIDYLPGAPAMLLIDVDFKGMPDSVRAKIKAQLGVTSALASVVPELGHCGCVIRRSTSTGLSNSITGEQYPGSEGLHIYVLVADGADIPRALQAWHDRCWLAGFGWSMVGAGGQVLERSLVDRTVCAPERLVFEGAPVLDPPLVQDADSRSPRWREGGPL